MRIQFIKNVHFTKLLKVSAKGMKEFNFRKIKNDQQELFSVDVSDDRGNRIMFHMEKEGNEWKIVEPELPKWIAENEAKLHELIEEELRSM